GRLAAEQRNTRGRRERATDRGNGRGVRVQRQWTEPHPRHDSGERCARRFRPRRGWREGCGRGCALHQSFGDGSITRPPLPSALSPLLDKTLAFSKCPYYNSPMEWEIEATDTFTAWYFGLDAADTKAVNAAVD